MKKRVLTTILAVMLMLVSFGAVAQQSVNVEESVKQFATELEKTKGVDCVVLTDGIGLSMVKKVFNPKFGKEFMKDVTSMVIVDYADASNEVRNSIRSKVDKLAEHLSEFKPDDHEIKEGEYLKSYATVVDEKHISNFMVITENKEDKVFFFMGGILNVEKMKTAE